MLSVALVVAFGGIALAAGVMLRLTRGDNPAIKSLAYGYRIQAAVLLLLAATS